MRWPSFLSSKKPPEAPATKPGGILEDPQLARRAIAYLKGCQTGPASGARSNAETALAEAAGRALVFQPFLDDALITYAADIGSAYSLMTRQHLERAGLDLAELHRVALENLEKLVNTRPTRVQPYGKIFAVLMGGDFEASLLLLDALWEGPFREHVKGEFVVAIPARDMLAFCDARDAEAIEQLRAVIARTIPGGDHLISDKLYVRRGRSWQPLDAAHPSPGLVH